MSDYPNDLGDAAEDAWRESHGFSHRYPLAALVRLPEYIRGRLPDIECEPFVLLITVRATNEREARLECLKSCLSLGLRAIKIEWQGAAK